MKTQKIITGAFVHDGNKLLLLKRSPSLSFFPGKYDIPGGHVEFGETLEDALKRESMEELCAEIHVEALYYAATYLFPERDEHWVEINYLARLKNPEKGIALSKEHTEFKWVTEQELERYFDKGDSFLPALRKGFEALKRMKQQRAF